MNPDFIDQGRMIVAPEFLPLLRANGLETFEKVMSRVGGTVVRDFPGRRTVRLELRGPDGAVHGVYLKRYEKTYLSTARRLLRRLRWPGTEDEARREWQMIEQVHSIGIPTATRIAVGQDREAGTVTRSFLITREIAGALEGHTYAAQLRGLERSRFLRRVAELARRFHAAGFVHKDFYLGHVLVAPGSGAPALFLIDLQRVVKPCCFRTRWVTKDLGALAYSALKAGVTRAELLRSYLTYGAHPELGASEKRAARRILRRVVRLRRHRPKHG